MIEARSVSKRFPGGVAALERVSLRIRQSETVALIGESGCGKTTLLRMFNRLDEPSEGSVYIAGKPATSLDPIELRRRTGYVPQDGGLLPHWTVARNIGLVPQLLGWDLARRLGRADELLELVDLEPALYRERYPRELSGGQR